MARKLVSKRKSEEIRRLADLGLSKREIARALKVHRRTVDRHLDNRTNEAVSEGLTARGAPEWVDRLDWNDVIGDVARGVPKKVLWEELHESSKVPVSYQNFLVQLRKRLPDIRPVTMRRRFKPGERVEIDYCDGIDILDPVTGEICTTQLFVGSLCFSRYTFAEFSFSQKSEDFLQSHRRMFEFFGGVPQVISPDNLKSAVSKTHRYDPDLNRGYARLAAHYGCAAVPARVRKPKDKAIVERNIQTFQRWFFFRVRRRTFTSLMELNQCLREHLRTFNNRLHRTFKRSRSEMFNEEREHLGVLPQTPYLVQVHHAATLHPDCHLMFEQNFYSAPFRLRGMKLDVWAGANTVEIYHQGDRVAFHARKRGSGKFATNKSHYPEQAQAYWDSSAKSLRAKAVKLGPDVSKLIHKLLSGSQPLQHLRRCMGIVRLAERYPKEVINKACEWALIYDRPFVQFIERLAKKPALMGRKTQNQPTQRSKNPFLRGHQYFNQ